MSDLQQDSKNDTSGHALLSRSGVYRLLATAFYPPAAGITEELWTHVISNWKPSESKDEKFDLVELRVEYNRLFVGPNALPCPPYESVYRKDRRESERGMLMGPSVLDVKKRYSEAGLDISKSFSDLPDHVAVELEFMSFLCSKEEAADSEEDADLWRIRQKEFWNLHMEPWIVDFSQLVLSNSRLSFFKALAMFLKDWGLEESEGSFKNQF